MFMVLFFLKFDFIGNVFWNMHSRNCARTFLDFKITVRKLTDFKFFFNFLDPILDPNFAEIDSQATSQWESEKPILRVYV